jgi:cyclopropane fatty-acyl-phospholipid synthase-like methyltransferase
MKLAKDPTVDYQDLVRRGYDQCAGRYGSIRTDDAEPEVNLLIDVLDAGAKVLDLGCGVGIPIARALSGTYRVTGVDFSKEMINLSRVNAPEAAFLHADIMEVDLPASEFDAVVSFYTVFHIPKEHHKALFQRIHRWLKVGGYLLVTVSEKDQEPYTEEFHGVTMYWSNYGLHEYLRMLAEVGFDIIKTTSVGHGYDQRHEMSEEHHPLIFAKKIDPPN